MQRNPQPKNMLTQFKSYFQIQTNGGEQQVQVRRLR